MTPAGAASTGRRLLGPFACTNKYFRMTINDYSKACNDKANNACTTPTNCKDYCIACDLYVNHSWVEYLKGNKGFTETSDRGGHRLVLPTAPCRGVEDWKTCGGDPIWDYAWKFAGGPEYGLAINPVQKRSRDQMHVHVAKLQQGLLAELKKVAMSGNTQWGAIVCPDNKVTKACKYDPTKTSGVQAKFVPSATSPSAAKPFQQVYGNPANEQDDAAVVSEPLGPGKGIVLLRANDRPAECFLYCLDVCQDYCK